MSSGRCSIAGCDRNRHARTWCGTHYARWQRLGTPDLPRRTKAPCGADDCAKPVYSNGWCVTHSQRMRRSGSTDLPTPTLTDRLAGYHLGSGGCWLWRGRPGKNGYGRLSIEGRLHYAHRVSYELHVGPIPPGLTIDHLCRVRLCVNPRHLEPVTRAENTRRQMAALRRSAA